MFKKSVVSMEMRVWRMGTGLKRPKRRGAGAEAYRGRIGKWCRG